MALIIESNYGILYLENLYVFEYADGIHRHELSARVESISFGGQIAYDRFFDSFGVERIDGCVFTAGDVESGIGVDTNLGIVIDRWTCGAASEEHERHGDR